MVIEAEKIENVKKEGAFIEDTDFIECEFQNCSFEECNIMNCRFIDCKFSDCNIVSLKTQYSQIRGMEFEHCNLIGMHWHELLPAGRIAEPLRKITSCYLKYNTFMHMNLVKFDFSGNVIQESAFDECDLQKASFRGCRLERTQYLRCKLQNADFRETNGYQIDIMSNKLTGARFSFPEAINLLNGLGIRID